MDMAKTTLNLRVDPKVKKDAEKVLSKLGISMTFAVTEFLKATAREGRLPFSLELGTAPSKKPSTRKSKEEKPASREEKKTSLTLKKALEYL